MVELREKAAFSMPRKKKSAIADLVKRVKYRKHKRRAKGRSNPEGAASRFMDDLKDTGMELLPTLGSFGGSTVLVRLFERYAKRFEAKLGPLARHSAALAWVATLLTVYLATTKIKSLRKYSTPALVGTSLAALVHLLPKYMPALGWLVGQPMVVLPGANGSKVVMPATPTTETYVPASTLPALPPASSATSGSDEALLQDYDDVEWGGAQSAVADAEDDELRGGIFGG